jgi:hypothetical protein
MKDAQKICTPNNFKTAAPESTSLVYAPLNNNGFVSSASHATPRDFIHRCNSIIWEVSHGPTLQSPTKEY